MPQDLLAAQWVQREIKTFSTGIDFHAQFAANNHTCVEFMLYEWSPLFHFYIEETDKSLTLTGDKVK